MLSAAMPELSPRLGAEVQWWFLHGALAPSGLRFMLACFAVDGSSPGHMLLHVLDGAGRPLRVESRISGGIAETHRALGLSLARRHLPEPLARAVIAAHMRAAEARAARDGIRLGPPPDISASPFALRWDGVELAAEADGLRLTLPLPGGPAQLRLSPRRPWLDDVAARLDPGFGAGFGYQCCPRLEVSGTAGGEDVGGLAWMDRQWGPFEGWFVADTPAGPRPVGWDWAGLSFADGSDLLAMRHRAPGAGPVGRGFAVLFGADGSARLAQGVAWRDLGHWTSPRTGIAWPVRRRLSVPGLDADLTLAALAEDQEIPVFGAPAIWEGAARAEGRIGGRAVSGGGRLELFGDGSPPSVAAFLWREAMRRLGLPGG